MKNLAEEFEKHKVDYELILVNQILWTKLRRFSEKLKKATKIESDTFREESGRAGGRVMYGLNVASGTYIGFTYADEEVSAMLKAALA